MLDGTGTTKTGWRLPIAACAAAGLLLSALSVTHAAPLVPRTKFRVKVVQWMPMKGTYEEWSALGGEFIVSGSGEVSLPVIGVVSASDKDRAALADDIASRLQASTGLVKKPDVSIEVIEYPPFYVVGEVAAPGEYTFRDGLTVLQALALSGGERRQTESQAAEQIRLAGELRALEDEMLRRTARIARLQAENAGVDRIAFPEVAVGDRETMERMLEQERVIFSARADEVERQIASLSDLRDLFAAEIRVLEERKIALGTSVKATEKQMAGIKTLIDKGFAVASREADTERLLANLRADQLALSTEVMRARQGIAEATRNLDAVRTQRRTEVAAALQAEEAALIQNELKRELTQRLLLEALVAEPEQAGAGGREMSFTITRTVKRKTMSIPAEGSTQLQPGDVLSVGYVDSPAEQTRAAPQASALASAGSPSR